MKKLKQFEHELITDEKVFKQSRGPYSFLGKVSVLRKHIIYSFHNRSYSVHGALCNLDISMNRYMEPLFYKWIVAGLDTTVMSMKWSKELKIKLKSAREEVKTI